MFWIKREDDGRNRWQVAQDSNSERREKDVQERERENVKRGTRGKEGEKDGR